MPWQLPATCVVLASLTTILGSMTAQSATSTVVNPDQVLRQLSSEVGTVEQLAKVRPELAALLLGELSLHGIGTTRSAPDALNWFALASSGGSAEARYETGRLYEDGVIGPADPDLATFWYRAAADAGSAVAMYRLGSLAEVGKGPDALASARQWFGAAAKAGSGTAAEQLGDFYREGRGVHVDPQLASRWYLLASALGDLRAEVKLAHMYETGDGVPRDGAVASQLLVRAARRGSRRALYGLADSLSKGCGSHCDFATAYELFDLAALGGDSDAAKAASELESKLRPDNLKAIQRRVAALWASAELN